MSIKSKLPRHLLASRRGTALAVVMILSAALLIILAAYVSTELVQKKVNVRATLLAEARNAAEGVAELAVSEITRRAAAYSSGPANPLENYTISAKDIELLIPTEHDTSKSDPLVHTLASSLQIKNSELSPRPKSPLRIDGTDPVYDVIAEPNASQSLIVRSTNVFSTASVKDPVTGSVISSYISQNIQIREQSWFNYGVFYNMDMEFHAGPNFDVTGPVHSNQNIYVMEDSSNKLRFYSTLTASVKILRNLKYGGSDSQFHGKVFCSKAAPGTLADQVEMDLKMDSNATPSAWSDFCSVACGGKVHDLQPPFSPDGMPTYIPEDYTTDIKEMRNYAYLMIEPQLAKDPTFTNARYGQKDATDARSPENIKFSALSGFTIRVDPVNPGKPLTWKLVYFDPSTDPDRPLAKNNLPKRGPDGSPVAITIDPFNENINDVKQGATGAIKVALQRALRDAIILIPYKDDGAGTLVGYVNTLPALANPADPSKKNPPAAPALTYFALCDKRQGFNYPAGGKPLETGRFHVLRIDLDKLDALINDATGLWNSPAGVPLYQPSKSWTGVVYVEFPLAQYTDVERKMRFPPDTAKGDQIRRAAPPAAGAPGYALVLANAKILPRLRLREPDKRADGFTVATNGPAYLLGNYNADGDTITGSSLTPDTVDPVPTATSEIPALIAADAVTVLSAAWAANDSDQVAGQPDLAKSYFKISASPTGGGAAIPAAAPFTEISTAIITGIVPTRPGVDNIWSGGVHNFVRFLENWDNKTYRYRGSLVALFESEVATAPFHQDHHEWYTPPNREAGYHQFLSEGWFPPGTPVKRTVRRMNLSDIYKSEYDAGPKVPDPST